MANNFSLMPMACEVKNIKGIMFSTNKTVEYGYLLNVDTAIPVGEWNGIKIYENPELTDEDTMFIFYDKYKIS